MESSTSRHISATGRLLAVLKDVQSAGRSGNALEAFVRVAKSESAEPRVGLQLLAQIYGLIEEARAEVRAHPEIKQAIYMSAIGRIDSHLKATPLINPANTLTDPLGGMLETLELCADQMDRFSAERELAVDELQNLIEATEHLSSELRESDLPTDLREALARRVEEIRGALVEYHIGGAAGMERAAAAALGTLIRHAPDVKAHAKSAALLRYLELTIKLDTAVRTVHGWTQLAAPHVSQLLTAISSAAS